MTIDVEVYVNYSRTGIVTPLLIVFVLSTPVWAQEQNVREVDRFGEQTKILTSGQMDVWVFPGKKDQTVTAWLRSDAFDPVLELVDENEVELQKVDDPGSQSRFTARLPADGTYRVRVRSFKDSGGGRYRLVLDLFTTLPLVPETPATATIGSDRRSHHRLQGEAGDLVTIRLRSAARPQWQMMDPKGLTIARRSPLVRIESAGEHIVRVQGRAGTRYGIVVRKARVRKLDVGALEKGEVTEDRVEAWDITGKPGGFATIDIQRSGPLQAELLFVPDGKAKAEGVIRTAPEVPEGAAQGYLGGLAGTGYFFPVLKITETVSGAMLLAGMFVPLALILLAPVVVQINLYHLFLDPAGIVLALVILALQLFLAWAYRGSWKGVLDRSARPTT